jgi:hypothetical protein
MQPSCIMTFPIKKTHCFPAKVVFYQTYDRGIYLTMLIFSLIAGINLMLKTPIGPNIIITIIYN